MKYIILLILIINSSAIASLNDVDKANIFQNNLLGNPGFELGKLGWTASGGTFSLVTSGSNLLHGGVSATWDSGSASQTLTSTAVAIPKGLYGKHGTAFCAIQTPSGSSTHTIAVYDGTNNITLDTIKSDTKPLDSGATFVFPSSGNLSIRLTSVASDEPLIAIDGCYLGESKLSYLTAFSQNQLAGESYFAGTTACSWTRASTSVGAFNTDADCPGPTIVRQFVGSWQTTDSNLPRQTVNDLPPGIYKASFILPIAMTATANSVLAINDGTTTCEPNRGSALTTPNHATVSCTFEYTSIGNRSFELYSGSESSTVNVSNDVTTPRASVRFILERYPNAAQTAVTPDLLGASWSGYHDNTCAWGRTNTAYGDPTADASCALVERSNNNFGTVSASGSVLPKITFTPKRAGRYYVCAFPKVDHSSSGAGADLRLFDGTNTISETRQANTSTGDVHTMSLCGFLVVTNTSAVTLSVQTKATSGTINIATGAANASALEWSIFQVDQQIPMPVIVNSVTTKANNVTGIESAKLNCDASSTITSQNGSWVSSIGNISAGACTVTLNSGVFSSAPVCFIDDTVVSNPANVFGVNASSATSVTIDCDAAATGTDCTAYDVNFMCIGPR